MGVLNWATIGCREFKIQSCARFWKKKVKTLASLGIMEACIQDTPSSETPHTINRTVTFIWVFSIYWAPMCVERRQSLSLTTDVIFLPIRTEQKKHKTLASLGIMEPYTETPRTIICTVLLGAFNGCPQFGSHVCRERPESLSDNG